MHYISKRYLTYKPNKAAKLESDNLVCVLQDEYSEYSAFKLVPSYKYQKDSKHNFIYDQDTIHILSTVQSSSGGLQQDAFLHASKTQWKQLAGSLIKFPE